MKRTPARSRPRKPAHPFPQFCDFDCPYASLAPPDAVGACRREQGIYCTYLERFNNRHNRCLAKPQSAQEADL